MGVGQPERIDMDRRGFPENSRQQNLRTGKIYTEVRQIICGLYHACHITSQVWGNISL